jgi:ornithine decarboxylase
MLPSAALNLVNAVPSPAPHDYRDRIEGAFSTKAKHAFELPKYRSVETIIGELRPSEPIFCINPQELKAAAARFRSFPGRSLYAVKCNPHPFVLKILFEAGITDFDVASIEEVRLISDLFGSEAGQFYNNPAKSRSSIKTASSKHGIRFYTADCEEEVDKILEEASDAKDLIIAVRISTIAKDARYVLSTKFGATPDAAVNLLKKVHAAGVRAGISFHVGSQCLAPQAFSTALTTVGKVLERARVPISVLNVGGGFPAPYPGDEVLGLDYYFGKIVHGRSGLTLPSGCLLLAEPGRSLVATAGTVLLQVTTRRDNALFLNDGVFGTLQELGHPKETRPLKLHRKGNSRRGAARIEQFRIYGPTCDSNDVLGSTFSLPSDVREGDWIEVGMMGAYSLSMRTHFNGFHTDTVVAIGE